MLIAIAVAVVIAALLLLVVLKRRGGAGSRGDLLGPPPGLGPKTRLASAPAPAPPLGDDWHQGAAPIGDLHERVAAEARQLIAQNRKLEAIKRVREANPSWSLTKAKEWVERL